MTSPQGLHLKTIVLILIMVSVAPLGDTFLGKGMKRIGPMAGWAPADLFHFFFRAFTSGTIWIGIGLLLAYFVAYLLVLSWADYSYVLPASSVSYVLIALLAHFVLHEDDHAHALGRRRADLRRRIRRGPHASADHGAAIRGDPGRFFTS